MVTLVRHTLLVILVWSMLTGVCLGKQLYLTDGGIIECKSFRQHGDQVFVTVNRDTVIELDRKEVDLRRTLHHGGKKPRQQKDKKPAVALVQPVAAKMPGNDAASPVAIKPPVRAAATTATPVAAKVPAVAATPAAAKLPVAAKPVAAQVPPVTAKPVPPPATVQAATPTPTPAPAPAAKEPVQAESTANSAPEPSAPLDKAEIEQRLKQSNAMMAEAIRKNDRELMKKAMELQQSTVPPEKREQARAWGLKLILIVLICSLLIVVSMWVVFVKAGESGWKSLVPFYNMYILMLIAGKPGWWVFLLLIPFVGAVFYLMAMLALAERFGKGALFGIGLTFLPMFFFPLIAFGGAQIEEFQFGT